MKIFKYPIEITGTQEILLPDGAQILTIQIQNDIPCIWALVNPNLVNTSRIIHIFGTGHDISDTKPDTYRKYIATFQTCRFTTPLVFHVFEFINEPPTNPKHF